MVVFRASSVSLTTCQIYPSFTIQLNRVATFADFCGASYSLMRQETGFVPSTKRIASLGPSEMKIKVIYTCDERNVNDDSVNDYLVVQVDFGSNIRCDYWNSVNAVEGILNPTTSRLIFMLMLYRL